MEKSQVLVIGCGGTGGRMLDELLELDKRYSSIFLNSSMAEMQSLKHFSAERRSFYIPNADGCGKDRHKMEMYIKEEAPKFVEMIKKFINPYVILMGSSNGGTGSMAIIMIAKLIKKFFPSKSVNIIATIPSLNESDVDYSNAIDFWNEVVELKKKDMIDSIQLIDNNKCNSEHEINIRAMKELDESFDIVGGKLDTTDSMRVHTSKGYKVFLKLDSKIRNIKEAIDKAVSSSVYFIPDNLECDILIGNLNINTVRMSDVKDEIESYEFTKFNEKLEGDSMILLGGCEMPKESIELVKEALKEVKNRKRRRVVEEDLIVKKEKKEEKQVQQTEKSLEDKPRLSSKDLNDLFADDDFWNN